MDVVITNIDRQPIYEQIYTQIKKLILSGLLTEDDPLPSIRTLAKDLRISVITTKRAYDELEKEGYIYTVAAKGCFVARKDIKRIREEHLQSMENHMRKIAELARVCDMSSAEVIEKYRLLAEEET